MTVRQVFFEAPFDSYIPEYTGRYGADAFWRPARAALYLYDLIDAVASPGNKRPVNRNRYLSFHPALDGTCAGIGGVVNL